MLFISFIIIVNLSLSFAKYIPICYWAKFMAPAIWDMTSALLDNTEVFLLNPASTFFAPFGAVLYASTDLLLHKVSFMGHGYVCLLFWKSHGWVGAQSLHRCSIWPAACPGVSGVIWVSRSQWSYTVVNIRCLIFSVRCARFKSTEPKAVFCIFQDRSECGAPGVSSFRKAQFTKFCLAFLENYPLWQKEKGQDNKVQCPFPTSISISVIVLSHV